MVNRQSDIKMLSLESCQWYLGANLILDLTYYKIKFVHRTRPYVRHLEERWRLRVVLRTW